MNDPANREKELFEQALDIQSPEERAAYLRRACGGDAKVHQRIEALLRAHEEADNFLPEEPAAGARTAMSAAAPNSSNASESPDTPTIVSPAADEAVRAPMERPGTVIGHYKLLEKLGEGGCGVVYMAEQEEPVRRRVALKIIKLGMDTREVIARFEAEQQALALMDHPNIAQVFDAGATETGRPYFVMELVRGVPITQFCDEQRVAVRERLELFMTVCQAVHHAHQKGIIHRDIKPSNVLVTLHDGVAVPKVIDFGIAKATQQRLTDKTLFTQFHQFLGTPAYMSPEQAELSGLDIDTRSDIYSLGVLLYELLAGRTPFEGKELLAAGLDEMRRRLREEEPVKPSTRLTMDLVRDDVRSLTSKSEIRNPKSEMVDEASSRRLLQKRKGWINAIRGDLDWIVMKALEKDRRRRYESASGFGQDVERYLKQEPVNAAAPSAVYKFRKFARRNRMTLTAVATIALVLIVGAVVSTWQAVRATRAEKKAQTEAAISKAVNDFLQNDLLAQASPESQPDRDLKLRTVLDRAAQKIEGRFTDQPLVEAAIRATIVRTYLSLGEARTAEPHARRAFELYGSRLGAEHRDTLTSMNNLARVHHAQGKLPEAATLDAQVLDIEKRVLGPEHRLTLTSMNNLASVYRAQGKQGEAATLFAHVLDIAKRVLGPEHPRTLGSMNNLASVYHDQGKRAEAATLHAQVLDIKKRVLGPEHPDTLISMNNLALVYLDQGKLPEAATLHAQVLDIRKRVLGPEHPATLGSMNNLASVYRGQGKLSEAATLHAQVLDIQKRVLGPEHPGTLTSMNNLAGVYQAEGKQTEAETLHAQVLDIHKRVLGPEHAATLGSMNNLADAYRAQGKLSEAATLHAQVLDIQKRVLGPEHPDTLSSMNNLAAAYQAQGKLPEAATLHAQALDIRKRVLGPEHPNTLSSMNNLARVHQAQGKLPEAATLYAQSLDIAKRVLGPEHPGTQGSMNILALVYQAQGKLAEAETLHAQVLGIRKRVLGLEHPNTLISMGNLAYIYDRQGNFGEAERVFRETLQLHRRQKFPDPQAVAVVLAGLGHALSAQKKFGDAEPLLRECLELRQNTSPDDWRMFNARSLLGGALSGQKRFEAAEPLLLEGYEGLKQREQRVPATSRVYIREAGERLVQLYEAWGKPDKAAEWKKKLEEFDKAAAEKKSSP